MNPLALTPTAFAAKNCSFTYDFLAVNDLRVETEADPKSGKQVPKSILVKDEPLKPTNRFWTSLFSRYGFNQAFFKYFTHLETFNRISETEKNDRMRVCIERDENGHGTILGVSNPMKPIVSYDELMEMLGKYNGTDINYFGGIVESVHTPRNGSNQFQISGDNFFNRFVLSTPVDGYGIPNIYLSLLREICQNGMIGYTKAFKASLNLGKAEDDVAPTLTRALDGFGNEEGYSAIRQRVESSTKSWASIYESQTLYKLLTKMYSNNLLLESTNPPSAKIVHKMLSEAGMGDSGKLGLLTAYHGVTGDINATYGLANLDAVSAKRQRTLPVKCTVYDLINLGTEIATHYAKPEGARLMQAWVGTLVSEEFDMEGTRDKYTDFKDFHVSTKIKAGMTGSANAGKSLAA